MPKISELPLANKLKEEDYIPIVQDGVTKKVKGTHFVTEEEYSLDAFSPTIAANDRTMYKFGEGDTVDFSDSAYDGAYKSAILKGNTLVNLNTNKQKQVTITSDVDYRTNFPYSIKSGTKITIKMSLSDNSLTQELMLEKKYTDGISGFQNLTPSIIDGRINITFHEQKDISTVNFYLQGSETGSITIKDVVILEGDYTNVDIPYFEGMKSVKMPVLTTTGKNLFDGEVEGGSFDNWGNKTDSYNSKRSINLIEVKPNTKYKIVKPFADWHSIIGFKENDFSKPINDSIGSHAVIDSNTSQIQEFTTSPTTKFLALVCVNSIDISQTMIVAGSETNYTFEPHKSNILSTPNDLILGSVGDVCDTLDIINNNVKQMTHEFVIDGSQNIVYSANLGNTSRYYISLPYIGKDGSTAICDKIQSIANYSLDAEHLYISANDVIIFISNDTVEMDVSQLKAYLSENPITVRYILGQEVHKTVDLSGTPFGYKGGHIIKSSAEGSLLPKFEYEVAVSRGAQISQNTSTLIKHDEKITELLKKTAAAYINQKAEIAYLLNMSSTLEEAQTIPFIEDDYVNDDCMVDSDMVMDDMQVEPEKEIIDNVDTLLIDLIYDLIELNDTLDLSEKVELFRQSGLIDKHNYEIIKEKLNPTFKEEDYADINQ